MGRRLIPRPSGISFFFNLTIVYLGLPNRAIVLVGLVKLVELVSHVTLVELVHLIQLIQLIHLIQLVQLYCNLLITNPDKTLG